MAEHEEIDGCSLLNPVYQNRNPVELIEDPKYMAYSYFHRWLYGSWASINSMILNTLPQNNPNFITINNVRRPFYSTTLLSWYKDPTINKNASNVTPQLIKIFNDYLDTKEEKFKNYKISTDIIKKAQEYHQKTDNCVKIDGWVGTQTNQLAYPAPLIMTYPEFETSIVRSDDVYSIYYPVIWGNKRYIISISDYNKLAKDVNTTTSLPDATTFKNMKPFIRSNNPEKKEYRTYMDNNSKLQPITIYKNYGIIDEKPIDLINPYILFSQSKYFDSYTKNQFKDYNQTQLFSVNFASDNTFDKQISDDWFTNPQPPKPFPWPVSGTTGFQTPNEIYNSINGEVNKEMTAKIVTVVKKFIS